MSLQLPVFNGLVQALRTGLPSYTWLTDPTTTAAFPYGVLYAIPGGGYNASLAADNEDPSYVFQVSCVGKRMEQAFALSDRVHKLLLDRDANGNFVTPIAVTGGQMIYRTTDGSTPGSEDGGSPGEPAIQVSQRYVFTVTRTVVTV